MSRNGKRQAIQNVWNNFTGNFSKKLKIEEEDKEPHFRFGKEQVVKNQSDTIQSPSMVSKHWERNDSTKSLDLSNQNSCIPRFVNRSSSIGGFYHNNQFIASKEANVLHRVPVNVLMGLGVSVLQRWKAYARLFWLQTLNIS